MLEMCGCGVTYGTIVEYSRAEEDSGRQSEYLVEVSRLTRDRGYRRVYN